MMGNEKSVQCTEVFNVEVFNVHWCSIGQVSLYFGPALMAVWSKALPLTASCLSPLSGFKSHRRRVKKLPMTLG